MTKTERLVGLMTDYGFTEVTAQHRTQKYRVFSKSDFPGYYFVGKAAGLRKGLTVSDSLSLDADRFMSILAQRIEWSKRVTQ